MANQNALVEELKALVEAWTRISRGGLSYMEVSQENTGGQAEGSTGGDQSSCPGGSRAGERAGSAPVNVVESSSVAYRQLSVRLGLQGVAVLQWGI